MNAHAPTPPDHAGGRAPLDEQVLVVQQADLLQHLAGPAPASEISTIAAALDRDPSNLRKTLQRLEREGLVVASPPVAITDKGRGWIPRLAALAGAALQEGQPVLTWAQIRPDPNNPRTILDPEADARLAENIARRGLKQPLLVRLDADGAAATLNDGFRRWSAIGALIEAGDSRWPADRPVPYLANTATEDAEILADAIVANLHHAQLHALDQAAGYARLKTLGWTPARILEECGLERRFYEQRLDLLHLTEAQQARMRLSDDDPNHLSIKGARGLLQHLRHVTQAEPEPAEPAAIAELLGLTDKLMLGLVEVAFAIEQRPGRDGVPLTHRPAGGALATLAERGLLIFIHNNDLSRVTVEIPKHATEAAAWLTREGFYDDPAGLVFKVRSALFGPAKADQLAAERVYATEELNTDPAVFAGRRFPNATHAGEARRLAAGGGPSNSGGGKPKAAEPPPATAATLRLDDLQGRDRIIFWELAHKILADPVKPHPLPVGATRVGKYWLDARLDRLVQELKLVAFHNLGGENGWLGTITRAGWDLLGSSRQRVTDAELEAVRYASGQAYWPGPGYVADWLNVEAVKPAEPVEVGRIGDEAFLLDGRSADEIAADEHPTSEPDEPDVDEAKAAEVLGKIRAGIATGLFGKTPGGFDHLAFRDLLEAAELIGPFGADVENAGLVDDRDAHSPVVCDVNNDLPEDLALAQAELVAFALNAVAGFSHTASKDA